MRLIRWAFGIRADLPLKGFWWHRLFRVLFALSSLTILLAAAAIVYLEPQSTQSNVNVIHTFDSYTTANPDLLDTVPTFL